MEEGSPNATGRKDEQFLKNMPNLTNELPRKTRLLSIVILIVCCLWCAIAFPVSAAEQVISAQELQKRSDALDHREQSLNTIEENLNARMAKLKDLETILKKMLDEANSVKDTRMQKLIDVYTNMKPQQAASVMETIDVPLAVKVLAGMKSRQAGEILNKMSKTKAAKISEELIKLQAGPDLPKKP